MTDVRTLVLRVRSPRGATDLDVLVRASGLITSAAVDGKTLDLRDYPSARDGVLRMSYNGIKLAGIELALAVHGADQNHHHRNIRWPASSPRQGHPAAFSGHDACPWYLAGPYDRHADLHVLSRSGHESRGRASCMDRRHNISIRAA